MKKILYVMYAISGGGIESMLYSYLTHMNRTDLEFDFVVCGSKIGAMEVYFEELGCHIYHLPHRRESLIKHCKELYAIIKQGHYNIVHSNQNEKGFLTLYIAKKCGVNNRILHCHYAYPPETLPKKIFRIIGAALGKHYATQLFACSKEAACWLFGKKKAYSNEVRIIPNAFELQKFTYDQNIRCDIRTQLGLEGALIIGCVARFEIQKNHEMLLKIFKEILKERPNTELLLVGTGTLEEDMKEMARRIKILDHVHFLGIRNDVPQLLMAMDAFVLPTLAEGLGIVFAEAQASGLPTFCSDIIGVKSVCVTELMHLRSLDDPPQVWAKDILEFIGNPRKDVQNELAKAGFDIEEQAYMLEKYYRELS